MSDTVGLEKRDAETGSRADVGRGRAGQPASDDRDRHLEPLREHRMGRSCFPRSAVEPGRHGVPRACHLVTRILWQVETTGKEPGRAARLEAGGCGWRPRPDGVGPTSVGPCRAESSPGTVYARRTTVLPRRGGFVPVAVRGETALLAADRRPLSDASSAAFRSAPQRYCPVPPTAGTTR
jgi:hypothetical protein